MIMYNNNRLITFGALIALAGYVLSGPIGLLAVNLIKPQPAWTTPANFVAEYHFVQTAPFLFGFLLVGGTLMMVAGHYIAASNNQRPAALLSLVFTIPFATLIFFNYIVQVSFIPNLVMNYEDEYGGAITSLSMSSPLSLCWNIEMWGYALLGVATWMLARYTRASAILSASSL